MHIALTTILLLHLNTELKKDSGIGLSECIISKREVPRDVRNSGNKTSSEEIGLDIRTHASPKVGQDQVSGGVSVLWWHAAPVANVLWKPRTIR